MTRSEKEPGTGKSQGERISHSAISKGASELGKFVCVSGRGANLWKLLLSVPFQININNG